MAMVEPAEMLLFVEAGKMFANVMGLWPHVGGTLFLKHLTWSYI